MNPRRYIRIPLLAALLLCVAAVGPVGAKAAPGGTPPFTESPAPAGWTWWCAEDNTTCLLLPDGAAGTQKRFLLVTSDVQSVSDTMAGWLGGGEVVWEGDVKTGNGTFDGQIVSNGTIRGLIGMSGQWAYAAIGLETGWESTAVVFNRVLRGEG